MMMAVLQSIYRVARSLVLGAGCLVQGERSAFSVQRSAFLLPVFLLVCMMLPGHAWSVPKPKVVMVVVPGVALRNITSASYPGFEWLIENDCIGVMNSRTAGRIVQGDEDFVDGKYAPEAGYATIGAGARVTAGLDAAYAYNADERVSVGSARDMLSLRTMVDAGKAEVVHPGIMGLVRDNAEQSYDVTIGALGSALHSAGLKTAVIGNSDDGETHREAVTIAMDERGLVDYGNVGPEMVIRDPRAPSGYRTNEAALMREFRRCLPLADFIVVELGDMARLDRARPDMLDDAYARESASAMRRLDRMVSSIVRTAVLSGADVIVLSPYPSSSELENHENSLCPVLTLRRAGGDVSRDGKTPGLLSSGSTGTPGVVANTDIAPTVMEWLGVNRPAGFVGRQISRHSHPEDPVAELNALVERTARQSITLPVLRQAMGLTIALCVIVTALWLAVPAGGLRRRLITPLALIPPALGPAMMLMALRPAESQVETWFGLILVTAGIVLAALLIGRKATNELMLIGLGTTSLFLADILLGTGLCGRSVMGYSIAEGSRYYGIGNEFMGVLLGASTIGISLLMGAAGTSAQAMRVVLGISLVVITAAAGAPMLGANMGGAISSVAAFGCALMATSRKALDVRKAFGVLFGVALFLGVFAFLDSLRGAENQSHLGRALQDIHAGGLGEAGLIIKRKLGMNWLLIRAGIWSRVLGVYIASIGVMLFRGGMVSRLSPLPLHLKVALVGSIAGAATALVFNDSGVVAAATGFAYIWSLVVVSTLESEQK